MSKINVNFTEFEETVLASDNSEKSRTVNGTLTISNPTRGETIWGMEITCENASSTNISGTFEVGQILPQKAWTKPYDLKDLQLQTLDLFEEIDVDFHRDESAERLNFKRHTLIANRETRILYRITLRNAFRHTLENITVQKKLDPSLGEVEFLEPYVGGATFKDEEHLAVWEISKLEPGKEAILKIVTPITPTNGSTIEAGGITVDTQLEMNIIEINPSLTSQVKCTPQVKPEEVEPGMWIATTKFTGNPELEVQLDQFEVKKDTGEVLFQSTPKKGLQAGGVWQDSFRFTMEGFPNLKKHASFTPLWSVSRSLKIKIIKESWILPVVEIEGSKFIVPETILSYARETVRIRSILRNKGTGNIGKIQFVEKIPAYHYLLPDTVQVSVKDKDLELQQESDVYKEGTTLSEDRIAYETLEISDATEAIAELKEDRDFVATITLSEDLTIKPGEKVVFFYNLHACKPVPTKKYSSPLSLNAWPFPLTKNSTKAEVKTESGEDPEIVVKFAKRSYDISAESSYNEEEEVYTIKLILINTGEVDIENIILKQEIPRDFNFEDYLPKIIRCEQTKSNLEWFIAKVEKDETVEITYQLSGAPSLVFQQPDPEIIIKG